LTRPAELFFVKRRPGASPTPPNALRPLRPAAGPTAAFFTPLEHYLLVPSPAERTPDRFERYWSRFVDGVTVVWLGVFLVVMFHSDYPILSLVDPLWVARLDNVLFWMTVFFIADLVFQYHWSGLPLGRFLRLRWFDVLMAIPFLRPLRLLRIVRVGRLARAFRMVSRSRNLSALYKKSKRAAKVTAGTARATDLGPRDPMAVQDEP
jgi:hypothetical protein